MIHEAGLYHFKETGNHVFFSCIDPMSLRRVRFTNMISVGTDCERFRSNVPRYIMLCNRQVPSRGAERQ